MSAFFNADIVKRALSKEYGFDRGIVTPVPIQGVGMTQDEAIESAAKEIAANYGNLFIYKPKDSDVTEPVVGIKFVTIHNDDKLHQHGSGELIDFSGVTLNPFTGRLEEDTPYGMYHSHTMPEGLFCEKVF